MRQLFVTLLLATLFFSCKNSGKKDNQPVSKDSATVGPAATDGKKPVSENPATADSVKTVKLTFTGYEEGDYAHLTFKETSTATEYDFGHPDDNNLNNIQLVIKDQNTAFGYKVNTAMIGKNFVADLVYKMADTYDGNGQPVKAKEWRINSIKNDQ